jgi:hypothetical protein
MMLTDLPLFAQPVVPPLHRRRDPSTSRDAAAKVARKLSPLHAQVLEALARAGDRGMTGRELEQLPQFVSCAPSTIRKRASELHHLGRLRDIGRRDGMTIYVLDGAA